MSFQKYEAYKDSGVEWLGEVPAHWKVTFLKRGYQVVLGKMLQPESKRDQDEYLPYLRAANIQPAGIDLSDIKRMWFSPDEKYSLSLQPGDLLVSEGGDVGRAAIWNLSDEVYFQNSINRIRSTECNSTRFLYYWMLSIKSKGYIDVLCNKSTIAHFTAEKVAAVPTPFPPDSEQIQIARFLDHETARIDALIAEQERLIELLKEKRQAVISHAVTKGLDPTAPMKDSGVEWLGEVPEHWGVRKIGYVAEVTKLTGFEYTNLWHTSEQGEIIALRGFNVGERDLNLENIERINIELSRKLERSILKKGDIVLPCTGTLGNAALIPEDNSFHINQNIAKLRFSMTVKPDFAVYWLTSSTFRTIIDFNNTSSMQPVLLIGDIRNIKIPIPPLSEQVEITKYLNRAVDKYNDMLSFCTQSSNLLQERRSALISAAVTGKIDVRGWQPPASVAPSPVVACG